MHDEPPVAEFVAETLDHDGAIVGQLAGGLPLFVQVAEQVRRGPLVEAGVEQPCRCSCRIEGAELANECAERATEFERAAERISMPERQFAGYAWGGRDKHLVVGDLDDAPRRRAEGEHLTDARLVDHLFVELADASRCFGAGDEDAEQPAVGDRAAAGDGKSLCAWPAGDRAGDSVPDQPGPQFGELVTGVAAGQHVEHRIER